MAALLSPTASAMGRLKKPQNQKKTQRHSAGADSRNSKLTALSCTDVN